LSENKRIKKIKREEVRKMVDPDYNSGVVLEEVAGDMEQLERLVKIVREKIKYLKKNTGLDEIKTEEILFQIRYLSCLLKNLEIEIEVEAEKEEIGKEETGSLDFPYFT